MTTRLQGLEEMEQWMNFLKAQQSLDDPNLELEDLDYFLEFSLNELVYIFFKPFGVRVRSYYTIYLASSGPWETGTAIKFIPLQGIHSRAALLQ